MDRLNNNLQFCRRTAITFCLFTLQILLCGCGAYMFETNYLAQAEVHTEKNEYQQAIESYQHHIEQRLADSKRAQWENPYFYLIRMGDLYLKLENPSGALEKYIEAENQNVEKELVSDRIRSLASWYESKNELRKAIDLLALHREKDQFLFDSMLNRMTRKLTELEQAN